MKKIFTIMIFVLLLYFSTFAQNENLQCPKVEINAPESIAQEGEIITFSVSNKIKIEYEKAELKWLVDKGKIISGQGTLKIEVDTNGFDDTLINATVEVSNLPPNCKSLFSASAIVATIKDYFPSDQYGNLSIKEESFRLDNFLVELINNPEFQGYVVMSYKEDNPYKKAENRVRKLIKHLKYRKFPTERIIFLLDKNSDEDETEFWRFPKNLEFTRCENCEIIKISN